jgi:hypothetical protein
MDAIDEVRAGQVQRFFRDGPALVLQQRRGIGAENVLNI